MATVSNTLALFDSMTGPLRAVMDSVNLTNSAMEQMAKTANRDIRLDSTMENARKKAQEANAAFTQINETLADMERKQNNVRSSGGGMFDTLIKKAGALVAAYAGIRQVANFFKSMIGPGTELNALNQSLERGFTVMMGSAEKAQGFLDDMMAFAKTTPFAYPELAQSGRNMIAFGMHADNVIPVLNSLGDAVSALGGGNQELMQVADAVGAMQVAGKVSMESIRRLHMNGIPALQILANQAGVTGDEMRKKISKGAIDANTAIGRLVEGIQNGTKGVAGETAKMGGLMAQNQTTWAGALDKLAGARRRAGAAIMEPLMVPLAGVLGGITNFFNQLPAHIAPTVQALLPIVDIVKKAFDSGFVLGFFRKLLLGVQLAVQGVSWVVQGFQWLYNVIANNWDIAQIFLWGLAGILAAAVIPQIWAAVVALWAKVTALWAAIPPLLAQAAAWMTLNWPIIAIFILIGLVIAILAHFGVTAEQVLGFVGGIFGILYAFIYNKIINLWNAFAMIGNFVANLFVDPAYAAKKLIYDMTTNMLKYIKTVVGALESLINLIPGVSVNFTGGIDNMINSLERPTSDKAGTDPYKMKSYMSYSEGAKLGYGVGANLATGIKNGIAGIGDKAKSLLNVDPGKYDPTKGANIDTVNTVKKVKGKVDISSEDLKVMRDLAEMKNIQNFVTLTPTVSVTTGDINNNNNGEDFDSLVRKLTNTLNEQIVSTAEGVYN